MSDIDRRRENLQDLSLVERLRAEHAPEPTALASSLRIALELRDHAERQRMDTAELEASMRRLRKQAARVLCERTRRLIAIPRTLPANQVAP